MMLRYRAMVVCALVMAFISAASLGAGIIGLVVILQKIIGENPAGLREQVTVFNAERLSGVIPSGLLERLPTEP